ncbi:MAG: hypothetical protein ISQ84_03700 [Pelagibacterales bacterium]|nr:hypothetical protein [Pelagibacterales bacterium]
MSRNIKNMNLLKKNNIIVYILILIIFIKFAEANTIFSPNEIPNIDYVPLNEEVLDIENFNKIEVLQDNRFFILYAYDDFKLQKNIKCNKVNLNNIKQKIDEIILELNKYKLSFFKDINFNYLVLCNNLYINNFLTAGIPNNNVSTLIFDISVDFEKISRSLHHEIFHMIKADGDYKTFNDEYSKINNSNHKYVDCSMCSNKFNTIFRNDIDGFVSEYGSSTLEEDQAEIFAAWMTLSNFDKFFENNVRVLNKQKILKKKFFKFLNYKND